MSIKARLAGFTLIEMLVAIIIISVGVVGILAAYNNSVKGSADALVGKQLVAIAEEMMEEILLKPFAIGGGAGAGVASDCGQAGANRSTFDDVRDYHGYQTASICDIEGQPVEGLAGYSVAVTVQTMTLSGLNNVLRVTVTAARGGQTMTLDGFRSNYGEAVPPP